MRRNRKKLTVSLPTGYTKPSLPWFTEWIEALESGNYRRATGALSRAVGNDSRTGYCCLGVLSKMQGRLTECGCDGGSAAMTVLSTTNPSVKKGLMGTKGSFPKGVKVTDSDGYSYEHLAGMNDRGYSFKTIAGIIKQIWKA